MTLRFVAPTGGISSGSGAIGSPWNLDYACSSSNATVQAGDIVFLRAGTYNEKYNCTKSGSSIIDGTARTDTTSANVLTATGVNLSSVIVGTDYIAITNGNGVGLALGEHYLITAVNDTADTVTIGSNFTTSGPGTNVAWRIYRPIIFRSCEWSCPDGVPDYTRTYEWAKFDGYVTTTLASSIGTATCTSASIPLTDGTHFPANSTIYIFNGTAADTINGDEYINILAKSGNSISNCQRNYSIDTQRCPTSECPPPTGRAHNAGDTVVKVGTIINIAASYNIWRDLQIMDSWPIRAYPIPARFVANSESMNFNNGSLYNDIINVVFSDNLQAVFMADGAKFCNLRGYITYNIGVIDQVRGEGLIWYMHGQVDDYRRITHGIAFNCATTAKAYGVTGGADHFIIADNTHFNTGGLGPLGVGLAANPAGYATSHRFCAFQLSSDIFGPVKNVVSNNWGWNGNNTVSESGVFNFGFTSFGDDLTVTNNLGVGSGQLVTFNHFDHAGFSGNTWVQPNTGNQVSGVFNAVYWMSATSVELSHFVANDSIYDLGSFGATGSITDTDIQGCKAGAFGTIGGLGPCYSSNGSSSLLFLSTPATGSLQDPGGSGACGGGNNYRFYNGCLNTLIGTGLKQWISTPGASINTSFTAALPSNMSQVLVNPWETGRCVARILNTQNLSTVSFNLSSCGFVNGDTYAIWDVQNFTAWSTGTAIATGTYNSASPSVTITTAGLTGVTPAVGTAGGVPVVLPPNTAQATDAPLIVLIARKTGTGAPVVPVPLGNGQKTFLALFGK